MEKMILKQIAFNLQNEEAANILTMNLQLKCEFLKYLREEDNKEKFEKYREDKNKYEMTLINKAKSQK